MENWIGIGIWIVIGVVIAMAMKVIVPRPDTTPGHTRILAVLGALAGVVGGMLGVGIFHFPASSSALTIGGMGGAVFVAALFTYLYRWGLKSMI